MRIGRKVAATYRKYRGEIASTLVSAAVGTAMGKVADIYKLAASAFDTLLIVGVFSTFAYMLLWSVMIKRRLTWKVDYLETQLARIHGPASRTQYGDRAQHFVAEKNELCVDLARKQLPNLIRHFKTTRPLLERIAIVIDSGTTLEGVFPQIKERGFGSHAAGLKITIFTNSLSGVEAFNSEVEFEPYRVDYRSLELIGGQPIEKYRATTGNVAEQTLQSIKERYSGSKAMILAVTTANWILPFHELDSLALCAKGEGHHEFKQKLVAISDIVLVVSPLGKMLCYGSLDQLNREVGSEQEQYKETIVDKDKGSVFLLTSLRKPTALLFHHARRLKQAPNDWNLRYTFIDACPRIDHGVGRDQELQIEIPHSYLQEKREKAFILTADADLEMTNKRAMG